MTKIRSNGDAADFSRLRHFVSTLIDPGKKVLIAEILVLLAVLAVSAPLIFAGSIETAESTARLGDASALGEWHAANPECGWHSSSVQAPSPGDVGTIICRYSDTDREFTLEGIQSFPGELVDSGLSMSSELDPRSMERPAWWVQGLMLVVFIGVTLTATVASGWSWQSERRQICKAVSWILPLGLVGLQAVWMGAFGARDDVVAPLSSGAQASGVSFVLVAVLFGPLAEEAVYRQYLYAALRRFPLIIGALVPALIFSLGHLGVLLVDGASISLVGGLSIFFLVGVALFLVRHVTGALLPCFAAHAGLNALLVFFGPY